MTEPNPGEFRLDHKLSLDALQVAMTVTEVAQIRWSAKCGRSTISGMRFGETFLRRMQFLLAVALFISSWGMSGCLESSFQLARESRMPEGMTPPPGLTRKDVSVTLNYYGKLGNDAKFILKDARGKKLASRAGKVENAYPFCLGNPPRGFDRGYPCYEVVVVGGATEIIEHRKMEPIFYINDDSAFRNELLARLKMKQQDRLPRNEAPK